MVTAGAELELVAATRVQSAQINAVRRVKPSFFAKAALAAAVNCVSAPIIW